MHRREYGMTASLILCFLRHLSEDEAFARLEEALAAARQAGGHWAGQQRSRAPAGEVCARCSQRARQNWVFVSWPMPAKRGHRAYIWSALDVLKVERIDHGVQATHDAALMRRLAQDRSSVHRVPVV